MLDGIKTRWIFEFNSECSRFGGLWRLRAGESETKREIFEIVGIQSRFPQTTPRLHPETRYETRSGDDGGSKLLTQWSGGPSNLTLQRSR